MLGSKETCAGWISTEQPGGPAGQHWRLETLARTLGPLFSAALFDAVIVRQSSEQISQGFDAETYGSDPPPVLSFSLLSLTVDRRGEIAPNYRTSASFLASGTFAVTSAVKSFFSSKRSPMMAAAFALLCFRAKPQSLRSDRPEREKVEAMQCRPSL